MGRDQISRVCGSPLSVLYTRRVLGKYVLSFRKKLHIFKRETNPYLLRRKLGMEVKRYEKFKHLSLMFLVVEIDFFKSLFPILGCFTHMAKLYFVWRVKGHVHIPDGTKITLILGLFSYLKN